MALQLIAAATQAGGLGELTVRSHLGQRFAGEIRLIETPGDVNPAETCFRLDRSDDGSSDIPLLTRARLSIERQDGRSKLLIFSDQIINDPVIQIRLRAGCGTELVRSYTALIDLAPATYSNARAESAPRPSPAAKLEPAPPTSPQSPSEAPPRAAPTPRQTPESESDRSFAQPPAPRQPRAPRAAAISQPPAAGRLADRLVLSGENEAGAGDQALPLRRSTEITSRALARKISENQRAMLRAEYRLLDSLYARAIAQLAITEQIKALDAQVENLLTANESAAQELKENATQAPPARSATDALVATSAQPTDSIPSTGNVTTSRTAPSSAEASEPHFLWLGTALAATLAIALTLYYRRVSRRRPEVPQPPAAAPSSAAEPQPAEHQARFFGTDEPAFQPNPAESRASTTPTVSDKGTAAAPEETLPPLSIQHLDIEIGGDEDGDFRTTLELVEIMMAFGKSEEATQTLEDYLAHHPGTALEPWLKLLEMHWMNGQQPKFESSLAEFRTHFNAAPLSWEDATPFFTELPQPLETTELSIDDQLQRLQIADTFPAIADEIRRHWGTQDALSYLRRLLKEPDPGTPEGLPLPLMRRLLLLKNALKSQLAASAASTS